MSKEKEIEKLVHYMRTTEPLAFYNSIINMQMNNGFDENLVVNGDKKQIQDFYNGCKTILNDKELTLLKISSDITNSLVDTKNEHFYRPLMKQKMFFDTQFYLDSILIKGMIVVDASQYGYDRLSIMIAYFDETDMSERNLTFKIGDESEDYKFTKKELSFVKKLRDVICNIIDMIDDDELVNISTIERNEEQNKKRFKRGKYEIPKKIIIRPNSEFKAYVDKYNSQRDSFSYTHKFIVRGHWRHLRSEKYSIEKRGTKQWIKPYIKGEGILIKKDYEVRN